MKSKSLIILVLLFSLIGLVASVYLTVLYYQEEAKPSVCDINDVFSCTTLSQTKYASILFGIPTALVGALGYLAYLFLAGLIFLRVKLTSLHKSLTELRVVNVFLLLSAAGLLFSFYLTGVEIALRLFCIFCLVQQLAIIVITWSLWVYRKRLQARV